MSNLLKNSVGRLLRKRRVRARVVGSAGRPRLSIHISNQHINAQIVDDASQRTLVSATSVNKKIEGSMTEKAAFIGTEIAKKAKKASITNVVLDRGSRAYARRLQALADAARKEGLEF